MADLSSIISHQSCDLSETNPQKHLFEVWADGLDRLLEPLGKWIFWISVTAAGFMSIPIVIDVLARFLFDSSLTGVVELEEFLMVVIVFLALGYTQKKEGHIIIDLLLCKLPKPVARCFASFNLLASGVFFGLMFWRTVKVAIQKSEEYSSMLSIPTWFSLGLVAFGVAMLTLVLLQQLLRSLAENLQDRAYLGLLLALVAAAALATMPLWLKSMPWELTRFEYGLYGMAFLMVLLLAGMPIGFAMGLVGFTGLGVLGFNLTPALNTLGSAPFHTTGSFILAVAPLFILMGLMATEAGISKELFDTAYKWLGRLPGGLAMAVTCPPQTAPEI
mgnify:CR=1 FL=1